MSLEFFCFLGKFGVVFFFLPDLLFIYSFLAALHLHCYVQTFSSCSEWGLLFPLVCGLLVAAASLVAEHGLKASGPQYLWRVGVVAVWHVGSSWTWDQT